MGSDSINAIDCRWVTPHLGDAAIVVTYIRHVVTLKSTHYDVIKGYTAGQ